MNQITTEPITCATLPSIHNWLCLQRPGSWCGVPTYSTAALQKKLLSCSKMRRNDFQSHALTDSINPSDGINKFRCLFWIFYLLLEVFFVLSCSDVFYLYLPQVVYLDFQKGFFFLLVMNFFALDIPCFWSLNSVVKFRRKVMWHVNMKYMLQFLVYLYFFHRYIQYFKFLNGLKILFPWLKKEQAKYMMSYLKKIVQWVIFFLLWSLKIWL